MREFRIKVNNEKTYVVKANDYNQAVKTLHSKLRDFDDTKKNINVVREFITNNGGKFSESKDADAILDFIYKKTGVKNADYGDVLYIVRNYTNVKVDDNTVTDFDLTNFLALKRSLELRIGEEIDFDKLEEYVNKLPKDKNGKKNIDVKEVIKRCIKAKDNAVSDSISRYTGEDAIRTNGFVKIKEDGDWTSYKYNGSDFDNAVFKIHQYNPSLIAFVSNGNRTITVRNKYLNDADNTAQGEIEVLKSFGFDYKDGRWVKESNNNDIIVQPDYHYVSVIGPGDTEKHCKKYQYQSAGMLKKIIASNIKDSSIKDVSYVSGKNLKIGQKIVEDGEVLEVVDIKETQRGVNNNYRDVTLKNVKTGATETVHFVNSALARLNDDWSKGVSVTVKVTTESLINAAKEHKVLLGGRNDAPEKFIGRTSIRFTLPNKDNTAYANIDNSQSTIHYNMYDDEFTYKEFGGKKDFNKAKLTEGLKKLQDYVVSQLISAGIVVNQSKVEVGGSSKFNSTWRQAQSYNDESVKDADPVKVEKIIRKEKSALGITYYLFQTKSSSGATIYYEVTDKSYHGEPTYSGGGIISFSLQSANDSLDSHLLYDKLVSKYGKVAGRKRFFLGKNDSVQRENDASTGYKFRITNNGSKWYYETTFPDGHTTLTGPYSSKQETEQYFHKHRPTEKLTDADPVKVEKIIRKEKSALGITYYIFQTKSSSGYTIYYQVTDKTYHGEPTYSGGGIISVSLKSANDTLDHNLLMDKLKAKYGEKEGTKRYLRGENDSAIKDKLSTSDANSLVEAYIDKYKYTHSNLPYVNKPKIKIFNSPEEFRDKFLSSYRGYSIYAGGLLNYNGYVVKLFTSAKDGKIESPSADNIFTIFPTTTIKDSNNIKNRKSYTIKVGDKQYKIFAESEEEAVDKYIKSKKQ